MNEPSTVDHALLENRHASFIRSFLSFYGKHISLKLFFAKSRTPFLFSQNPCDLSWLLSAFMCFYHH